MPDKIHKFEAAGLGKAPFKFVFFQAIPSSALAEQNPTAYNLQMSALRRSSSGSAGGQCEFCGMPIMNCYLIKSADGNTFWVGCECVTKTGDAGLKAVVDKQKRLIANEARHAKEAQQIEELRVMLNDKGNQAKWDTTPHPRGFSGKTMMDYIDWMYHNSGNAGKIKLLKMLKGGGKKPKSDDQDAFADRCDGRQMMRLGR